jgi:phosphatidylglycerophosphatase A
MNIQKAFLTVGYSGLFPKAPGTVGSFVSLLLALLLLEFLHPSNLIMLSILITIVAVKQINDYEKEVGIHDSKEIVVDELVGMWIAFGLSYGSSSNIILIAIVSFCSFRLFDIWKPSIIGKIDEKVDGGLGVMGDDIVAGIAAGIFTVLIVTVLENFLVI